MVKQRYAREAMASAFRILGEGQLSLTKFLILTDQPVDLKDFRATLEHLLARTHPETDLFVFANLSMDTLDYTGTEVNKGSKGVWLGLGDPVRELPRAFSAAALPAGVSGVHVFCGGCLVVGAAPASDDPDAPARIARIPHSPTGRCWSLPTSRTVRRRAPRTSSGRRSRASSRPPTSTRPRPVSSATTSCTRRQS